MLGKKFAVAVALTAGLAGSVVAASPAAAGGDTARQWGCAAHWRNTATWNECVNSSGINVQLQTQCNWWESPEFYYGTWRWVRGSIDPSDRYECKINAVKAKNAYS